VLKEVEAGTGDTYSKRLWVAGLGFKDLSKVELEIL
jgi:hypothetical protein